MKKNKAISIIMMVLLVISFSISIIPQVGAADEADIELAISNGIAWLVLQQDPVDGKWQDVPRTGFVLIKLQDRAIELELDPFETDPAEPDYYEYATNVIDGWKYLFSVDGAGNPLYAIKQTIGNQDHTLGASGTDDDPDTRVNGYGIYFAPHDVYSTGICLMALAASDDPTHINEGLIDFDGDMNPDTFGEIAQDCVDWLAFAQADVGTYEGGYSYSNIFLFVTTTSPGGQWIKDTLEMPLANSRGKWLGSGIGDLYFIRQLFKYNVRFPTSGVYTFKIVQGMRDTDLKGIRDIGLRLEKAD